MLTKLQLNQFEYLSDYEWPIKTGHDYLYNHFIESSHFMFVYFSLLSSLLIHTLIFDHYDVILPHIIIIWTICWLITCSLFPFQHFTLILNAIYNMLLIFLARNILLLSTIGQKLMHVQFWLHVHWSFIDHICCDSKRGASMWHLFSVYRLSVDTSHSANKSK